MHVLTAPTERVWSSVSTRAPGRLLHQAPRSSPCNILIASLILQMWNNYNNSGDFHLQWPLQGVINMLILSSSARITSSTLQYSSLEFISHCQKWLGTLPWTILIHFVKSIVNWVNAFYNLGWILYQTPKGCL